MQAIRSDHQLLWHGGRPHMGPGCVAPPRGAAPRPGHAECTLVAVSRFARRAALGMSGAKASAGLRCAIAHRGILGFRVRCGACHRAALCADPLASPRNDGYGFTRGASLRGPVGSQDGAGGLRIEVMRSSTARHEAPPSCPGLSDLIRASINLRKTVFEQDGSPAHAR